RSQRFPAVTRLADNGDKRVAREHLPQHLARERLVVNQQYADGRRVSHRFFVNLSLCAGASPPSRPERSRNVRLILPECLPSDNSKLNTDKLVVGKVGLPPLVWQEPAV